MQDAVNRKRGLMFPKHQPCEALPSPIRYQTFPTLSTSPVHPLPYPSLIGFQFACIHGSRLGYLMPLAHEIPCAVSKSKLCKYDRGDLYRSFMMHCCCRSVVKLTQFVTFTFTELSKRNDISTIIKSCGFRLASITVSLTLVLEYL